MTDLERLALRDGRRITEDKGDPGGGGGKVGPRVATPRPTREDGKSDPDTGGTKTDQRGVGEMTKDGKPDVGGGGTKVDGR